jgi:hypothetical protein
MNHPNPHESLLPSISQLYKIRNLLVILLAPFKFQSTTGKLASRETREGWPLMTVQTAANETLGVHMKRGPSLVRWAGRFCPALAALVNPVQNIIYLTAHFFTFSSPLRPTTWAGQAVVLGRLSLCLCL